MKDIIFDFIKWFDLLPDKKESGIKKTDLTQYVKVKLKELGKICKCKENEDACELCKYTDEGDGITPCNFCVTFTDSESYFK